MIYYDEALPMFVDIVIRAIGKEDILNHIFLREASGKLAVVFSGNLSGDAINLIRREALALAPWVEGNVSTLTQADLFNPIEKVEIFYEFVECSTYQGFVRVAERRVVGQDWLRPPAERNEALPPIVAFASHKGGVGRSTALAVSAAA